MKESGLFPGFFGGVFCVDSCCVCISKEFCFCVINSLVFMLTACAFLQSLTV